MIDRRGKWDDQEEKEGDREVKRYDQTKKM